MSLRQPTNSLHSRPIRAAAKEPAKLAVAILFIEWGFILFDFDYFLTSLIGMPGIIQRIRLALLIPLILSIVLYGKPRDIYWPLALFVLLHMLHVPFTPNRGFALIGFKKTFVLLVMITATISMIRTPSRMLTLYNMFLLSFPWFVLHGVPSGHVHWHTELGSRDAFGPLGVIAMGIGYFSFVGFRQKSGRYIALAATAGGVLAVVASFARGAFVGAAVVGGLIWLRARRKLAALMAGVAGIILLFIAAEVVHPGGAFWAEMATIEAGSSEGTGESRIKMWTKLAWPAFLANPIFGVGANCIGIVGTKIIQPGELKGRKKNPATLYLRQLHNIYFQLLSEQGLVGTGLWLFMLFDFFRRLSRLRTPSARANWSRAVQGRIDLLYISLGLEAAMVGFLVCGVFYNQLYRPWFYTYLLFAILLSEFARRTPKGEPHGADAARPNRNPNMPLDADAMAPADEAQDFSASLTKSLLRQPRNNGDPR